MRLLEPRDAATDRKSVEQLQQLRVEALRAAAQIASHGEGDAPLQIGGEPAYVHAWTLMLAEHFAKWLETGER